MIKAGITGGIGSGKTTVCKIFSAMGVPVFHADEMGRALYDDARIIDQVLQQFGPTVLDPSGAIDRKALADIVFQDNESLAFLNALIHPAVRVQYQRWLEEQANHDYTLYEAAILMESGQYKNNDLNIVVVASEPLRLQRVVSRDGVSTDQVRQRMENQWSDKERKELADYVICNDKDTALIPQVLKIHQEITGNN